MYRISTSNIKRRNLSVTQLVVLFILENNSQNKIKNKPNLTKIAKMLDCTSSAVGSAVNRLVEQKLVTKNKVNTGYRGGQHVVPDITRQGSKVVAQFMKD